MNITCGKTQALTSIPPLCALAHRKHSLQQITISFSSLHATNFHEVKLPRLETCRLEQTLQALWSQNILQHQLPWYLGVSSALKRNCPSGPPSPWVRDQGLSGIVGLGSQNKVFSKPKNLNLEHARNYMELLPRLPSKSDWFNAVIAAWVLMKSLSFCLLLRSRPSLGLHIFFCLKEHVAMSSQFSNAQAFHKLNKQATKPAFQNRLSTSCQV